MYIHHLLLGYLGLNQLLFDAKSVLLEWMFTFCLCYGCFETDDQAKQQRR